MYIFLNTNTGQCIYFFNTNTAQCIFFIDLFLVLVLKKFTLNCISIKTNIH